MTRLNIGGNKLTFATLPLATDLGITNASNYVYFPQQELIITQSKPNVVDLSSQAKVGETETTFAWTSNGEALTNYTAANGIFTISKSANDAKCTMTNEALPKQTLTTAAVYIIAESSAIDQVDADNSNMPVEYYNTQGIKVSGQEPGLYIRRQGNKTTKVIVK